MNCTLLARHDAGYRDPWLIVTDLAPTDANIAWYALCTWVECGFKDSKRGGWHWEQTKMTDPARAEWLRLDRQLRDKAGSPWEGLQDIPADQIVY
jgi:hypothetical protein